MDDQIQRDFIKTLDQGLDWGESHIWQWQDFQCHWRVLGNPEDISILLIHGFGASSEHWRNNAKELSEEGLCVYGLDLVGFGKSEQPKQRKIKRLDNKFWADQVGAFLEEVVMKKEGEKTILLGNSLGGLTALTTAVFYPNLVAAVIASPLADCAEIKGTQLQNNPFLRVLKTALVELAFSILPLELIVPLISRTSLITGALQSAYYKSIKEDIELKKIVTKPARRANAAGVLRSMCKGMALRKRELTAQSLLRVHQKAILRAPMLLVWGAKDKLVPLRLGNLLTKEHPWLKLLIMDKVGHCPHDEMSAQFNQIVLTWLKTNLGEYWEKS